MEAKATLKVNAKKKISGVNIYLNNLSTLEIQKEDAEEKSYTLFIITFHKTNPLTRYGSYNCSRKILIESLEKKDNTPVDEGITITTPLDLSVPDAKKDNPQENSEEVTKPLQNTHGIETSQKTQTTDQSSYFSMGFLIKFVIIFSMIPFGLLLVYENFRN